MLRLVHDIQEETDAIPFPVHRVAPRGRLVGPDEAEKAQRTLELAQAQLDELQELMNFEFVSGDDGPRAA